MAHSNGKITAPVGIDADIAPVLGVGSYDLGFFGFYIAPFVYLTVGVGTKMLHV